MLGQLLSNLRVAPRTSAASTATSASTSTSRPASSLASVQEDLHTRGLLFPECHELHQHQHDQVYSLSSSPAQALATTAPFDTNADVDLEARDVRVILVQESTKSQNNCLLYDSHAPPPPATPPTPLRQPSEGKGSAQGISRTSRQGSISSARRMSVGQGQHGRAGSTAQDSGRAASSSHRRPSLAETYEQHAAREHREEVRTFMDCIFGMSVSSYKGTGTKLHIVPTEAKASSQYGTAASRAGDGNGSFGSMSKSSFPTSKLAQSYTSETLTPASSSASFAPLGPMLMSSDKKKVLVTRIFSVPMPSADVKDTRDQTPTPRSVKDEETNGYPFPASSGPPGTTHDEPAPKPRKTPMYAIGLIIDLPPASNNTSSSRGMARGPGSFFEQDSVSCGTSYGSAKRGGWTMLGVPDSLDSSFTSDADDRFDTITQHWDIIMRTLSHLQASASAIILAGLKQADAAMPEPRKAPKTQAAPKVAVSKDPAGYGKLWKTHKLETKLVQLSFNALAHNVAIHAEVEAARGRIVRGIKAMPVVTGQGRWGIWRDEARWIERWAGGKAEGFFFFNLLTAFLGLHTEWIAALSPTEYRRRHHQQQRASRDEGSVIPARTILVSNDKMAARRLIFLLSTFLPANPQQASPRALRPSTSTSFGGCSQSPPSFVPVLREDSLRRRMNKRRPATRHSRTASSVSQQYKSLVQPVDADDGRSIRSANLPIPGSDITTRKSSAAATTTVTPSTTNPHFSTRRSVRAVAGPEPTPRPDGSGSLVADDLIRSLQRDHSTGQQSTGSADSQAAHSSRWSSVMGSFWSQKGRTSTDTSPPSESQSPDKAPSEALDFGRSSFQRRTLPEMVDEVRRAKEKEELALAVESILAEGPASSSALATARPSPSDRHNHPRITAQPQSPDMTTPDSPSLFSSPVRASINAARGSIDVDVPLPASFLTSSFTSSFSSPSSSGYLPPSTPGLGNGMDGFEHFSPTDADASPRNVGGWMSRFHEDFILQAVQPVDGLLESVKNAMRAEPDPRSVASPVEGAEGGSANGRERGQGEWITVSTALVADATTFSIRRLQLRRRVVRHGPDPISPSTAATSHTQNPSPSAATSAECPSPALLQQHTAALPSVYGNPYLNIAPEHTDSAVVEEEWTDEPVVAWDSVLVDAVERVISRGGELVSAGGAGGAGSAATSTAASVADSTRTASTKGANSASSSGRASLDVSARGSAASSRSASLSQTVVGAVRDRCVGVAVGVGVTKAKDRGREERERARAPKDGVDADKALPTRDDKNVKMLRERDSRDGERTEEVPKGDCRGVLIGALETVIRDVIAEEIRNGGDAAGTDTGAGRDRGDSVLKEGVRDWVIGVETRW